ncbi:hypothetical protein MTP99_018605 [Tenebrio molitor]|nr:hypothetical protein MTP99_018605 [Tenebrio molitor]
MGSEDDRRSGCTHCSIPRRFVMVFLASCVGLMNNPARDSLNVAKRYFIDINILNATKLTGRSEDCKHLGPTLSIELPQKIIGTKTVKWDPSSHVPLNALFLGSYMISHVPSGVVSDKYGAKHVIETSLVLTSVCLIFTPVLVHTVERNAIGLYLVTLVTGVAQGLTVPAMASFLAHWAPARERGTLVCIALGGLFSGTIINNLVTESMIIACDNWSVPFYVYGGMGLGLLLIWHLIVYSNPHLDPHITSKERLYLDIQMKGTVDHKNKTIPVCQIFTSLHVWSLSMVISVALWYWIFIAGNLPRFMNDVWKFHIRKSKMWASAPFAMMVVMGLGFGVLSDWLINNRYVNVVTMRKVCTNVGCMGPAVYMLTASYAGCHRALSEVLVMIALGLMGVTLAGCRLVVFDLSPNYAGFLVAFCNLPGFIASTFTPAVVHAFLPNGTVNEYKQIFFFFFLLLALANFVFVVICDVKLKKWNQPERPQKPAIVIN